MNQHVVVALNLKQTFLSAKALNNLGEALKANQTLTNLNISHNYIGDFDIAKFVKLLSDN